MKLAGILDKLFNNETFNKLVKLGWTFRDVNYKKRPWKYLKPGLEVGVLVSNSVILFIPEARVIGSRIKQFRDGGYIGQKKKPTKKKLYNKIGFDLGLLFADAELFGMKRSGWETIDFRLWVVKDESYPAFIQVKDGVFVQAPICDDDCKIDGWWKT